MKKCFLLISILFLSGFLVTIYSDEVLSNVGRYDDTASPMWAKVGGITFYFPPNSVGDFDDLADCIDGMPGNIADVVYHQDGHDRNIIDSIDCF